MTRLNFFGILLLMNDEQIDIELEAELPEPHGHGDPEHKVKKLKEELERIKKEKQDNLDGWHRAKADYVNALRRFEDEKKEAKDAGVAAAIEALLPAYDAIERAKEHGELPPGFDAIVKQLEAAFSSLGLAALGTVGEDFNPALHEALGQDEVKEKEQEGTVTALLERGWMRGGRVLRPAKVRVAHYG